MREYQAVRIEGGLFAPDLLDQLRAEELSGQKPRDFGLKEARRGLTDEMAAVFADATDLWRVFSHRLERLKEDDPGTTITRDAWVVPFLGLLGYELHYNRRAYTVGGLTFAISHRAGEHDDAPPVHIVGANQELGRLAPSGRPRLAPHSLLQEFLNRTDALWGLVTNGRMLRLLRDSTYIRRQCYVEFDLEAIFEQRLFQDFVILYRLLHRTRLPLTGADASQCLLERYYQDSVAQGGRVRERLRDGVEECLQILANALLAHPKNDELRCRVMDDAPERRITPGGLYRQLLRLVYRFLFLLVSEDRGLISSSPLYLQHYSVTRFRQLVDDRGAYSEHHDLWLSLRLLWRLLNEDRPFQQIEGRPPAALLGLPVLDGGLFEPIDLDSCHIRNEDLLRSLWHLINYQDSPSSPLRRVNYAALDVEELGSVYESLLEYHPRIYESCNRLAFELVSGPERKSTGSYYTPAELVGELVGSTLEPVVEERLKGPSGRAEQERALLSIKIVDPACGSGHFMLAAARHLGKRLARIRTGEEEPTPDSLREATRDVIAHCIYGVDKNPLAVELCRVALWIEGHTPGRPLTFLDHRIRCGDSLVGVLDQEIMQRGIPDEAFSPLYGEDRKLASFLKKQNRNELLNRQLPGFDAKEIDRILAESEALGRIPDLSPRDIEEKRRRYDAQQNAGERLRSACNIWVAAFFQWMDRSNNITTATLRSWLESGDAGSPPEQAQMLALRHRFFHWPLEFPDVIEQGGFDVVLGNPPWEQVQLEEQEFFAIRDPELARAPNAAARKRLIKGLASTRPDLWQEYKEALHDAESTSRFLRASGQYPLTGRGRVNTYSVFAERMRRLLRPGGRAGIIVPTGIATDDTNKHFFADLVERGELISLFDFENREGLFPAVDSRYKFSLLTVGRGKEKAAPELAFFATRAQHLRDPNRRFTFTSEEIARINPNTRTLPVFRTRQDAELTRAIYERVPVLINERTGENPWGVSFKQGLFNMASASHLFRTAEQLETEGFRRVGNRFVRSEEVYLPLYEAKMIWHYDHRYGTYEGVQDRSNTHLPTPGEGEHADAAFLAQPWYWVAEEEVQHKLGKWEKGWLMGWRDVTNSTNERTAIFSMLPRVGIGHTAPLIFAHGSNSTLTCVLLSNFSSLSFDWIIRQKMDGTHLTFFILRQLPILPPSAYTAEDLRFILPRVLELVYTAWDIKPFADDVWRDADEDLRAAIRLQCDENAQDTGGHTWDPPEWTEACPDIETDPEKGIPLPPFKWDEDRRARLRAELDAYYARLYGLTRKQLRYILDPADLTEKELKDISDPWEEVDDPLDPQGYEARTKASSFPGETFRVLKDKEIREYGEYRTRQLVLEAWERFRA